MSQAKADPILDEAPTLTIAGVEYPLRRLGLRDVFRVARILGSGISVIGDAGNYSPGQLLQVLVASMTRAEDDVLELIADLIGVKRKDLDDTARFPMDSIITVLQGMAEHMDLKAFLARVQTLMENNQEMQIASQEPSSS